MTLLALPDPKELTLADVQRICLDVIDRANDCDDLELVIATKDAFSAFAEYLRLHDAAREGEATLRYLEVRVGELLGEAPGRGHKEMNTHAYSFPPVRRQEFRQMAEHPDVVDDVINESTEQNPPSRAKVLNAIKELERVSKEATAERSAAARPSQRRDFDRPTAVLVAAIAKFVRQVPVEDAMRSTSRAAQLAEYLPLLDPYRAAAVTSNTTQENT